jgi:predicted AAA+ superfamily ATPase
MSHFGRSFFRSTAYFSLDDGTVDWNRIFGPTSEPETIARHLGALQGWPIRPGETLIVLDEIQDHPPALRALKYFAEAAADYHVIAAGSALGVMLHQREGFPVGKVQFQSLHPLSFIEFVRAALGDTMADHLTLDQLLAGTPFHDRLMQAVREYTFLGGLPGVVAPFLGDGDYQAAAGRQDELVRAYLADFSKYAPTPEFAERLRLVWRSIPAHLGRENQKFIYSAVRKGARAKDFDIAVEWLRDSSLATKVTRVERPDYPLAVQEKMGAFKLFVEDVGVLARSAEVSSRLVVEGNAVFGLFAGALAEQFACQQLTAAGVTPLHYWTNGQATAEIDFLTQDDWGQVIPIEVKSGLNLRAKSLKVYQEKFKPAYALRCSAAPLAVNRDRRLIDVPLYALHVVPEILARRGDL